MTLSKKIHSQFCHNVIHAFLKVIALYKTQRMCGENRVKGTTLKHFMSDSLNEQERNLIKVVAQMYTLNAWHI